MEGAMHAIVGRRPATSTGFLRQITRRSWHAIGHWFECERQRRALARLDERLLADIGITRERQIWECARWTWLL
jgi:uncharacterized protein YjiS (DUF1127 family)